MERVISLERLFTLGQYKNMKWIETVEFNDFDMTDTDVDLLRYALILNTYLGFALHRKFLEDVNASEFNADEIIHLVMRERGMIEGEEPKVLKLQIITKEE